MATGPRPLAEFSLGGRTLHDWGDAAGSLRRSLKLFARGDRERARRLLVDSLVSLRLPPPPLPRLGEAVDLILRQPVMLPILAESADVIVPIHNGAVHVRRLFATLFSNTDRRHRILLADDGSTDPEVIGLLEAEAARRPNVRLLRNSTNRGFITTVNAALLETSGHVAVLNTDTEVPAGWLDRLLHPIVSRTRIASTTPFSNAAAIYSFPRPDLDQELPVGLDLPKVDAAFACLCADDRPELEAPTAIGFCMGIHRAALQACGPLDATTFGRGYCEETDWCLRASAAGWRSVLVPNLFVYHAHGGTFAGDERKALLEANIATLHRRWPGYYQSLTRFRRIDPWAGWRAAAMLLLADPARMPTPEDGMAVRRGHGSITVADAGTRNHVRIRAEWDTWRVEMQAANAQELDRFTAVAGEFPC